MNGNIVSVRSKSKTTSYVYDSANQLIRENNEALGKTWAWTYDAAGNILSKSEYDYTTADTLGTATDTVSYVYDTGAWGDLLKSFDGQAITYDGIGNPTSIGSRTFTWKHGRELATLTENGTTWTNTYNADGLRIKRTDGTTDYIYYYAGGKLVRIEIGDKSISLSYDASGVPMSLYYGGSNVTAGNYYYVTNLQGDVVAILDDAGTAVVTYAYDAWGRILSIGGSMADTLGVHNPLRYRGYVYDQETGLYYLQSRYYDPEMGRFLNADGYSTTGQGFVGNNMFAYCLNNPVSMRDNMGTWPEPIISHTSAIAGDEAITYYNNAASVKSNIKAVDADIRSLPREGVPNSSQTLYNPDKSPKQKRWYGPDGEPVRDRDYNHAGDMEFPHDHVWSGGTRQQEHSAPSPEYEFSGNPLLDSLLGIGLTTVCVLGAVAIAADDISGVGVANDGLLVPLGTGIIEGLRMIFMK